MEARPTSMDVPACPGCVASARRIAQLEALVVAQEKRIKHLEQIIDELRRGGKRQAAPFSKGPPKSRPKKPGRKSGSDHGAHQRRQIPPDLDEIHEAPLPPACPKCGCGQIEPTDTQQQYQVEIPTKPIHRQFNVQIGRCGGCGKRVQGRHELQTSDALGACASQLGANAQALTAMMNKDLGLSHGKIRQFFRSVFGIVVSRGGVCQAMQRVARRCAPAQQSILEQVRQSDHVVPDETGWRIGGDLAWLHVVAARDSAAYLIDRRRGYEASVKLLGGEYGGKMTCDGWAAYRRFWKATIQTCLGHLTRRCGEMEEVAKGGAVVFPRKVKSILQEALGARAGPKEQRARVADELQRRMEKLIEPVKTNRANERLAGHLWARRGELFEFLRHEGVDATNWRAEQALRPAVVNRKVWGGSRTESGAGAQSVLMTVLQTLKLRAAEPLRWLSEMLCAPRSAGPILVPQA
jgi:transposase